MRTVTRRGGITAWALNAMELSMTVTSSLARVSPAANPRLTVISTQTTRRWPAAGGPKGYNRVVSPHGIRDHRR